MLIGIIHKIPIFWAPPNQGVGVVPIQWVYIVSSQLPYFSITILLLGSKIVALTLFMDENNNIHHHTSISDISLN
jgi:hypothetical protein